MRIPELSRFGFKPFLLASAVAALTACGGGGGGSSSSSEAVTAHGVITELGSIWVNGVEYETPAGATYSVDDSSGSGGDFKVGMVVSLKGRRNDDGVSGSVTEVEFESEVEGIWDATAGTVSGITIIITDSTNITDWSDQSDGVRVEVSGLWIDNNTIEATYIKNDDDDDTDDELKGIASNVDTNNNTFTLRGQTISYIDGVTIFEDGTENDIDGALVEVHLSAGTSNAVRIEIEDDFFSGNDDGEEIEFEGVASLNLGSCAGDILVDELCVDVLDSAEFEDGLTQLSDITENMRIEVEGFFDSTSGLFMADEVKGRGNRVKIETDDFANASASSIELFPATNGTDMIIVDLSFADVSDYDSSDGISGGIRMEGILTSGNAVVATRIEERSVSDDELRGPIDNVTATSFTVADVTVEAASLGSFEEIEINDVAVCDDDVSTPSVLACTQPDIDNFFGALLANDIIEAEGTYNATTHTLTATKLEVEELDD